MGQVQVDVDNIKKENEKLKIALQDCKAALAAAHQCIDKQGVALTLWKVADKLGRQAQLTRKRGFCAMKRIVNITIHITVPTDAGSEYNATGERLLVLGTLRPIEIYCDIIKRGGNFMAGPWVPHPNERGITQDETNAIQRWLDNEADIDHLLDEAVRPEAGDFDTRAEPSGK